MPARSPFTALCQSTQWPRTDRADLHLHSTASDGRYTPEQIVDVARRTGLSTIALTDHDTLDGIAAAQAAANGTIEIIPAVELSCEHEGREVHLLAYFVPTDNASLNALLNKIRIHRCSRYAEMAAKLNRLGVTVSPEPPPGVSPGRRHLAEELLRTQQVGSIREAFNRYLDDRGPACVPKAPVDIGDAIQCARNAGGIVSYAHPTPRIDRTAVKELGKLSVQALEVEYPGFRASRTAELRQWAEEFGLATTGGSDCHGPDEPRRSLGSRTISKEEVELLRERARG